MLKTNHGLPLSVTRLFCSLGPYKYVRTCTTLDALHPTSAFCQVTEQACPAVTHHLPLETSWLLFDQSLMTLSANILGFSPLKFLLPHLSHGSCLNTSACLVHSTTSRCSAPPASLNTALILCTLSLRDHTLCSVSPRIWSNSRNILSAFSIMYGWMNPLLPVALLAENRIYSYGLYESGGADQASDAFFIFHILCHLRILFSSHC